eukprot:TRINITY_DN3778_c0_g2_i1.p1 TRINITY_DN3778_c0_g2~~TRINITY_DN3778_c0_g2_i1.p1  ORF type:complete len:171 (+),score=38.57 TRINITY_DN3778_c0_g2_i1:347-859(+)
MVGYATFYTMAPVFSLVLDEDVGRHIVFMYPELYKDLQKGRVLSYKTFFIWVFKSVYQGGVIMLMTIVLFESAFINIVAITYTVLILTELLNVALEVYTWHAYMVYCEIMSIAVYFGSMFLLKSYFDVNFILTWGFCWRVVLITSVSCFPVYIAKYIHKHYNPPSYLKVR